MKRTDFYINTKPFGISLVCPYCHRHIEFSKAELNVPKYWWGDWGEVECPCCEQIILLGDYDCDTEGEEWKD